MDKLIKNILRWLSVLVLLVSVAFLAHSGVLEFNLRDAQRQAVAENQKIAAQAAQWESSKQRLTDSEEKARAKLQHNIDAAQSEKDRATAMRAKDSFERLADAERQAIAASQPFFEGHSEWEGVVVALTHARNLELERGAVLFVLSLLFLGIQANIRQGEQKN